MSGGMLKLRRKCLIKVPVEGTRKWQTESCKPKDLLSSSNDTEIFLQRNLTKPGLQPSGILAKVNSKKVGFIEPKMSLRSKTLYEKDFRSAEIDENGFCETSSDPGSRKKIGKSSRHKTLALPGNSTTTDDTDDQDFTKSQKLQQIGKTLTYQESGDRSLAKNGLYLNSDLHKPYEDFQEADLS